MDLSNKRQKTRAETGHLLQYDKGNNNEEEAQEKKATNLEADQSPGAMESRRREDNPEAQQHYQPSSIQPLLYSYTLSITNFSPWTWT